MGAWRAALAAGAFHAAVKFSKVQMRTGEPGITAQPPEGLEGVGLLQTAFRLWAEGTGRAPHLFQLSLDSGRCLWPLGAHYLELLL